MIKKIKITLAMSLFFIPLCGASIDALNNQLNHVQSNIKAVKLSWQKAAKTLLTMKNLLPSELYQHAETTAKNILTITDVNSKMKFLVTQQKKAIVEHQRSYTAINFLSDYFPEMLKKFNQTMQNICIATANKAYRLLLLQQLMLKEKELLAAITASSTT